MSKYNFPKSERLTNKKKFDLLFEDSQMLKAFPIKLMFRLEDVSPENALVSNSQFAFTVPKRSFKKAVDRNYIKRRMKEAYRLNKQLIQPSKKSLYGIFIYTNREKQDYHTIEKAMVKVLRKLNNQISEK